jgi:hypothetical protein
VEHVRGVVEKQLDDACATASTEGHVSTYYAHLPTISRSLLPTEGILSRVVLYYGGTVPEPALVKDSVLKPITSAGARNANICGVDYPFNV